MEGVEFAPTTKFENERSNDDHMADTLIDLDGENPTTKSSSESMQKGQQDDRSMTGLLIDLADDTSPVIPGQGHGVTNIRLEEAPRGKSLFAIDGKAYEEDPEIQTSRERLAEMSIEVKASQPTRQKVIHSDPRPHPVQATKGWKGVLLRLRTISLVLFASRVTTRPRNIAKVESSQASIKPCQD